MRVRTGRFEKLWSGESRDSQAVEVGNGHWHVQPMRLLRPPASCVGPAMRAARSTLAPSPRSSRKIVLPHRHCLSCTSRSRCRNHLSSSPMTLVAAASPSRSALHKATPATTSSADFWLRFISAGLSPTGPHLPRQERDPSPHNRRIDVAWPLATRASQSLACSPWPAPPPMRFVYLGSRLTLRASSPRSVALAQLRFARLAVASSAGDLHPEDRAHAGRTRKKGAQWAPFSQDAKRDPSRRTYLQEPGKKFDGIVPGLQRNSEMRVPPI